MAREFVFSRLLLSVFSAILAGIFTLLYRPNADEHMALDHAMRESYPPSRILPALAARFRAFIERAQAHTHYFGGRYQSTDHPVLFAA